MRRWRYRPLQAVVVGLLAALITASAGFAPLYYRAMQQALAGVALDDAPYASTSLQLSSLPGDDPRGPGPETPGRVAQALTKTYRGDFLAPVLGYDATSAVLPTGPTQPVGPTIWRSDVCEHLSFTAGRCPQAAGEVAVSQADVNRFGYAVGRTVRVVGRADPISGRARPVRLEVVGVYRQKAGGYWLGFTLTGRSGTVSDSGTGKAALQHDVWVTSRETMDGSGAGLYLTQSRADFRLDRDATGVDELLALEPVVRSLDDAGARRRAVSGLPDLADGVRHQIDQSRTTVPLLMAQLCLLVVVVLWLVLLAMTEQRRPEVALARLHGRGRAGARRLLLAELLPVSLLGVVPGAVLALLATWFARALVLPTDPPFEVGWTFLVAVLVAAVLLAVVTVLAVGRVAREPVERLLRRVPPRRSGWGLNVGEALLIAGAGAVVVLFATGSLDGPVALAAPGLLAVVVGLVLAHLTMPSAAVLGRRQLRRGQVRNGVSVLDAARSPATGRIVAMVTLAAALAVFSADALSVGARNRALAAEQEAGASRVVEVAGTDVAAVRAALDDVDPGGRQVTPVVRINPASEDAAGTLAVVPDGFRRIAYFPGGAPTAAQWDRLRPSDVPPIPVVGTRLDAVVDSTLAAQQLNGAPTDAAVGVDVVDANGEAQHITLGRFQGRVTGRQAGATALCREGCTLTGLWVSTLPGATLRGKVTLHRLTASPSGTVLPIGPASQWRAYDDDDNNYVSPSGSTSDALTLEVADSGLSLLTVDHAWLPGVVPALSAGSLPSGSDGNRFSLTGLDGQSQEARRTGSIARVPASHARTFVADLDTLARGRAPEPTARVEVWFADDDPALLRRVTRALADHGVAVATDRTLAQVRQGYDDSAAAWSLQLAVLVGVVALLIGALVLLVSAVSTWRMRARDLAALRMSGVSDRATRSMAVASQLPALVVGVVAGAVSGLVGAQLALPIVPLFADDPEVSTLDLGTAWGAVGVATVVAAAVLGLSSLLIGRTLAGRAHLRRLRETL